MKALKSSSNFRHTMPTTRCSFVSLLWCWQLCLNILLPVSNELLAIQETAKKQSSECRLTIFCDALPKVPALSAQVAPQWVTLNSSEVCYFIFRWVLFLMTGFPASEFPPPHFLSYPDAVSIGQEVFRNSTVLVISGSTTNSENSWHSP